MASLKKSIHSKKCEYYREKHCVKPKSFFISASSRQSPLHSLASAPCWVLAKLKKYEAVPLPLFSYFVWLLSNNCFSCTLITWEERKNQLCGGPHWGLWVSSIPTAAPHNLSASSTKPNLKQPKGSQILSKFSPAGFTQPRYDFSHISLVQWTRQLKNPAEQPIDGLFIMDILVKQTKQTRKETTNKSPHSWGHTLQSNALKEVSFRVNLDKAVELWKSIRLHMRCLGIEMFFRPVWSRQKLQFPPA